MEDQITRTCNPVPFGVALFVAVASPIAAKPTQQVIDPVQSYVQARAAEIAGDHGRAVNLLAAMATADPADQTIVRRAIATAIQAGDTDTAIRLAKTLPLDRQAFDSRLLLAADALKRGRNSDAISILEKGNTATEADLFLPLMKAWVATAEKKRAGVDALAAMPPGNAASALANDNRALMLLSLGAYDEALPLARAAIRNGESNDARLRLALADGFQRGGRVEAAREMLAGNSDVLADARAQLNAGKPLELGVDTPAKALASTMISLSSDFLRDDNKALPIALIQIALHAQPDNVSAKILLALLLDGDDRSDEAVALLAKVPPSNLLSSSAILAQLAVLTSNERYGEALRIAEPAAQASNASSDVIKRYADVLGDMDRHAEAAAAYGRAIDRAKAEGETKDLWTYHLLRAASLEEVDRWPEAKADLDEALKLEPENPVLLNFMGYGKLERGEDIRQAEAMIRKASALRPDDASITDSLGWALFKTGRTQEAITTLRKAAAADAAEAEIHEHLGDALYSAGRRIEARFSWNAAMVTAKDKDKPRLQSKLDYGLNKANAAP
nr:tetratricopeptide repeat protein [uncultured Sphingomonas sp.]